MNRNTANGILLAAVMLAVSGCNLELRQASAGDSTIDALAATALQQTAVEKTRDALRTQDVASDPTSTATLQPTPTFTPSVTLTPTLEKVTVTVSKNTNCREGPDKFFDLVGIMKVGETAEAIGRNAPKTYWVIRLPSNTAKQCWLWYEWATVTGNGDALPVLESPPTPTWSPKPDFTFFFAGTNPCGPNMHVRLQITNTGNVPWEAVRINIKDTVTDNSESTPNNFFLDASGCAIISEVDTLLPGETVNTLGKAPAGSSGHNVLVTVHLYTENGGGGTHMSGEFSMTMP